MLTLLWLHFFWCLVPSWIDGVYYAYGWIVAPVAVAFAWRRHAALPAEALAKAGAPRPSSVVRGPLSKRRLKSSEALPKREKGQRTKDKTTEAFAPNLWLLGAYLALIIPLRFVEIGDPTWRIPIWVHSLALLGLTGHTLWRNGGWARVMWFLPVIVFALTAVPLPWQVEQALVRRLTGWVTGLTQEAFILQGVPVERAGETLHLGGEAVEVGDACSGIRSLQGLFMVALFFGELLWLDWGKRLLLIGIACLCALVTNTARAYYLAQVQFDRGEEAAAAVHDLAGHTAFAASALLLFLSAWFVSERRKGRVVVRRTVASGA